MKSTCHCKDVPFGSYKNTVMMITPWGHEHVCIDTCIATEIGYLWHQGVKTLNSCCGHAKLEPSVVVSKESVERMRQLGYRYTARECANPGQTFEL